MMYYGSAAGGDVKIGAAVWTDPAASRHSTGASGGVQRRQTRLSEGIQELATRARQSEKQEA